MPGSNTGAEAKRAARMSVEEVQRGNARWWTAYPMAYDWPGRIPHPRFSLEWFDAIDAAFLHAARLFATDQLPFDRMIPYERLAGRQVLEIGCGMGLHTELMIRAGAQVTAVDLTSTAVEATEKRLALKGLQGRVLQADAEELPLGDAGFDFVWSWGVIHSSSRTAAIVRHMARVLRPGGECRAMVYNRAGMAARAILLRDHFLKLGFLRRSPEETLYRGSDGFTARYYTREHIEDLFRGFFRDVTSQVCGQEADAVPLPNWMRRWVVRLVSERYLREAQARRGAFIVVEARHPF